jgi:hypothetical protein
MQKDTKNVLLSAGVIAATLGVGAYAYYEQSPVSDALVVEDMPVSEIPSVSETSTTPPPAVVPNVDDDYDNESEYEDELDDDTPKTVPVVVSKPVVTTPPPVVTAPVVVATPTPVVVEPTPVVKPTRQSRAS